jgi:hypothetical protein
MKFLKAFLFNLALYIIGFTVLYFIAPELWRTGFQILSVFAGPTGLFLLVLLVLIGALPRKL